MKKEENSKKKRTSKAEKPKKETKKKEIKAEDVDIDLSNINIDLLDDSGSNKSNMQVGEVLPNVEKLNKAANIDNLNTTVDLVSYAFANNEDKPIILEKILSDGDARIKEISTINALQEQLNITKLSSLEQVVLDDIVKSVENIAYLSLQDKLDIFTTINGAKERGQKQIFEYIKMSNDFNSMPTIYRQLVDKLMIMPDDKINRLKVLPMLMEVPDELWNRIVEIVNLWNRQ